MLKATVQEGYHNIRKPSCQSVWHIQNWLPIVNNSFEGKTKANLILLLGASIPRFSMLLNRSLARLQQPYTNFIVNYCRKNRESTKQEAVVTFSFLREPLISSVNRT